MGAGIIDMLSQFKILKQPVVHNSYSDNSIMFRALELCPQLTELTFTSNKSRDFVLESLDPKIGPTAKLQYLHIIIGSLSKSYTRYFTSYIEHGLKSVKIRVERSGEYNWIEKVGMEDALTFMNKLGRSNNVSIGF